MTSSRLSFDRVHDLIAAGETHTLELKSASYLDSSHPNHSKGKRPPPSFKELRNALRAMLGSEAGALANASGGLIVFGVDDKTLEIEESTVPPLWGQGPIRSGVEDVLRASLSPPLQGVDIYEVISPDGASRLLVISIPESQIGPHQSSDECIYYVRIGTQSQRAEHWILEAVRSKNRSPILEVARVNVPPPSIHISAHSGPVRQKERGAMNLHLPIRISNVGNVIAERWALEFRAPTGEISIDSPLFTKIPTTIGARHSTWIFQASHPIFPKQSLEVILRVSGVEFWLARNSLTISLGKELPEKGVISTGEITCVAHSSSSVPKESKLHFSCGEFSELPNKLQEAFRNPAFPPLR